MPKVRIYNISSLTQPPGICLDFMGHFISNNPNRPLIIDVPVIPEILERWVDLKWAKFQDADDKTPVSVPEQVTPGLQVKEANKDLLEDEEDFDLSLAKEAALIDEPGSGPVALQPVNQTPRAKITLGTEDKMNVADSHSPIPGDRPVSVDDSEQFTVRAPRQQGPGAVVKSS